jgi:LDH2 family malate/lactate/ureidoglycolate dehydrogenase
MPAAAEAAYGAPELVSFAHDLLSAAGMPGQRASTVAEVLVEGDLLGHTTHGLQLLAPYLKEIAEGKMRTSGEVDVVADRGAAVTWDGRRLPGPWLVVTAIDLATERARQHGLCAVSIRRSHHIACLAAYLKRATDRGMVIMLMSSDPAVGSVAPYGGTRGLYTPNPLAAGFPTTGDPVLLDVSMSTTTNGLTGRLRAEGRTLDHPWLLDAAGQPSRDPAVLFADPPGSILPLGGIDSGHKGFALGLLVEALTAGLGGFGRADPPAGWGAAVYLQVIDPEAFGGGLAAFRRETGWFADAARANPPAPGHGPVRLPGERGLRRREAQLASGVELYPAIMSALAPWAERYGVTPPAPIE